MNDKYEGTDTALIPIGINPCKAPQSSEQLP